MKKLVLLIASIMVFGIAANAQQRPNMTGIWKAADNPTPGVFAQVGNYITFTNNLSHVGAGYWVSSTQAKLIQTMTFSGCSIDMYLIFTVQSKNVINLSYQFLQTACGWASGATGSTTLTRVFPARTRSVSRIYKKKS